MIAKNQEEIQKDQKIKPISLARLIIETIANRTGDVSQFEIVEYIITNFKRIDRVALNKRVIRNNIMGLSERGVLLRIDKYGLKFDDKLRLFRIVGEYTLANTANNNLMLVPIWADLSEFEPKGNQPDEPFNIPTLSTWKAPRPLIKTKSPLMQTGGMA